MTLRNETNGLFAQRRFFDAKGLSYFGGCGTRGICSHQYPSHILAVPVLSLRSTGIPKMLKLLWLKSSFAQKPLVPLTELLRNNYERTKNFACDFLSLSLK